MLKTVLFLLFFAGGLIGLAVVGVRAFIRRWKKQSHDTSRPGKGLLVSLASLLLAGALLAGSQLAAHTPAKEDASGDAVAELVQVTLNGRDQWISIRGADRDNPVLLFLAGGPGGTQMGAVRRNLARLEESFVVVNWDQAGSGKSFHAAALEDIGPQTYVRDGVALSELLIERFEEDKIYLMGESWGSALGVFLVDRAPEKYYALIGTGQMVDFEQTERECYQLALQMAKERGDEQKVAELLKLGEPPYHGDDMALDAAAYLQYLSDAMARNPEIHNAGYETFADLASPEYGILDQINFFRGVLSTFSQVYPQLYGIDLREDYRELEVPVYFFIGRHDLNAPTHLAQDYYEQLQAPDKAFVWFEHSGHSPWINESDRFVEETLARFTLHE